MNQRETWHGDQGQHPHDAYRVSSTDFDINNDLNTCISPASALRAWTYRVRPGTSPARHRPSPSHRPGLCWRKPPWARPGWISRRSASPSVSFCLIPQTWRGPHHPRAPSVPVSGLVPRCGGWLQFAGRRRRRRAFRNTARHAHPFPRACSPQRGAASRVAPFLRSATPAPRPHREGQFHPDRGPVRWRRRQRHAGAR